jgi:uncharacterized protein YbaP (TraB family)
MKHLFLLTSLLISTITFSQNENSLLYRISGNGITKPSYLFGTIHISCEAKINTELKNALDATTQMYLELDMDDPELQTKMAAKVHMKDGATISSFLSAEDYQLLDSYLKEKLNVSAKAFNTYKPFFLSSFFLSSLLECAPQSFESELVKISAMQKEPVFGLETVEEQMDIFDQIPYQLQAEELIKSIRADFKSDKEELNALLKAYTLKDLNEMQVLFKKSDNKIMSDYEDLLLVKRNKNWIGLIERISKEQPTFFGVGAAHLIGDEGVVNLLRRNGYLVEAL